MICPQLCPKSSANVASSWNSRLQHFGVSASLVYTTAEYVQCSTTVQGVMTDCTIKLREVEDSLDFNFACATVINKIIIFSELFKVKTAERISTAESILTAFSILTAESILTVFSI